MSLYKIAKDIQIMATNTPMVMQSSFGDIALYENKVTIKYPYVNIDIVDASVVNYAKTYKLRIYVCDRNVPYIAYNKCETILDNLLKSSILAIDNYKVNYFTLQYQDSVNGVWADIEFPTPMDVKCRIESDFMLLENLEGFILTEEGDYIKQE